MKGQPRLATQGYRHAVYTGGSVKYRRLSIENVGALALWSDRLPCCLCLHQQQGGSGYNNPTRKRESSPNGHCVRASGCEARAGRGPEALPCATSASGNSGECYTRRKRKLILAIISGRGGATRGAGRESSVAECLSEGKGAAYVNDVIISCTQPAAPTMAGRYGLG